MAKIAYEIKIKRKFFFFGGKEVVEYECPGCQRPLESDLTDAGGPDACPFCDETFLTPGVEVLQKRREVAEARQRARQRAIENAEQARRDAERRAAAEKVAKRERDRQEKLEWAKAQSLHFVEVDGIIFHYNDLHEEWEKATSKESDRIRVALKHGYQYIELDGIFYIYLQTTGGWRAPDQYEDACIRQATKHNGRPWFDGPIISRNDGTVIVPPFVKTDGTKVVGYTRNAPGEGPSSPRSNARHLSRDEVLKLKLGG